MRKQEEAMRIMEALSGVDGELLARCEAAGAEADIADIGMKAAGPREEASRKAGRKGGQNVYRWRYLSRCAAVLALVVVGAVSWRGFQVSKDTAGNESAAGGSLETFLINHALDLEGEGINGVEDFQEGDEGVLPISAAAGADANGAGGTDGLDGALRTESVGAVGCPMSSANKLTAEEAMQIECLGDYVPTLLPAGYVFETAEYETKTGRLTVCWNRGMDNIIMGFRQVDSAAVETVDIQRPETYDERLYEIPFGEAVPEEYRQAFFAPVFAKDDFSLEIVRSCMLSYSGDGGDAAVPGGHFSVLYDGVLVYFDGRGTPEEIWEMFASISE